MLPFRIVDRLKFFVERQLVKGAGFQLLVVAAFIALISLIGGLLVFVLAETFSDLGPAIWWAFLRLTDPGYLGDDVGTWQRIVSTILTVSGYVVFMGTLVAIMTRWLFAKMADLERGLTPVTFKNHIVVLGWTSQTLPLLSELLGTSGRVRRFLEKHDAQKMNLVVLSEQASAFQAHELRRTPGIARRARQVILRSGSALQPDALHRVACLDAAAVIIPGTSNQDGSLVTSDIETVKALLSIAALARQFRVPLPFVVAEIQDVRKLPVIERAYPGALEVVAGDIMITRLIAQNVHHRGLSEVYNELLVAGDGNEIFIRSGELLAGLSLAELASTRPEVIVLGLLRENGHNWSPMLLAPSDTVIDSSDRVIMLARDYAKTELNTKLPALPLIDRPAVQPPKSEKPERVKRILILGWNRKVPSLISEFTSYRHTRFDVDVVAVVPSVERERAILDYVEMSDRVSIRHVEADYMVEGELRRLAPEKCDTVILLSSDRLAKGEEADARAMVGYLLLEDIFAASSQRPQLIMELSDPDNRYLLNDHQGEMLISPMILSHALGQVALRRELRVVLEELFTAGGAEIQFKSPANYSLPASVTFHLLEKILAAEGEIALGVYRAEANGAGLHLALNPPRKEYLNLREGDRLVVLCLAS
ncbi:MAG TPA: ion channel DMI1 [Marinobacter sp.]|nr:ion channel DMI1 [Marinobacter sp.]